jgi:hypothetical protein
MEQSQFITPSKGLEPMFASAQNKRKGIALSATRNKSF